MTATPTTSPVSGVPQQTRQQTLRRYSVRPSPTGLNTSGRPGTILLTRPGGDRRHSSRCSCHSNNSNSNIDVDSSNSAIISVCRRHQQQRPSERPFAKRSEISHRSLHPSYQRNSSSNLQCLTHSLSPPLQLSRGSDGGAGVSDA